MKCEVRDPPAGGEGGVLTGTTTEVPRTRNDAVRQRCVHLWLFKEYLCENNVIIYHGSTHTALGKIRRYDNAPMSR